MNKKINLGDSFKDGEQINKRSENKFIHLNNNENKELSDVIHSAVHDIRSPLTVIKPYISFLNKVDDKEKRDQILAMMSLSVTRMENIINGLVEYTDILLLETPEPEITWFVDVLEEVQMELSEYINASSTIILSDFSVSPNITFPIGHFKKILFHLLDNAIKYSHEEVSPIIRIYTQIADGCTIFTIIDNGEGIELENYDQNIGEPFTKLKKDSASVGLGLAIVNALMTKNNGKVNIKSDFGGTTVQLILPN